MHNDLEPQKTFNKRPFFREQWNRLSKLSKENANRTFRGYREIEMTGSCIEKSNLF